MVRKSFTLMEVTLVLVILSFLLIGGFQIIGKIYERNFIAKKTSEFEIITQQTLDILSGLLYYRIPLSVIGYNPDKKDFKYIGNIVESEDYPVLEWIGEAYEVKQEANLSGFVDLYASIKPTIKAKDFNSAFIKTILQNKFKSNGDLQNLSAIIFAGSFDRGEESVLIDYNNSFGWHGNNAKYVFPISSYSQNGNDCDINISNADGKRIYEKFYLADSAYAISLAKDINISAECIQKLGLTDVNSTLLLFYNYRPWRGETFCADKNGNREGNVTILAEHIDAFRVKEVNSHLELKLEMKQKKGDITISVSKQKVAF